MKIIAHRGNLNGRNLETENHPEQILRAIKEGFDVEVDAWFVDGKWYLGHDDAKYEVKPSFFSKVLNPNEDKLWIHAKNLEAVEQLRHTDMNWFWHENDKVTITSRGYIWCFPGYEVDGGIMVEFGQKTDKDIIGVCTDNPIRWRQ